MLTLARATALLALLTITTIFMRRTIALTRNYLSARKLGLRIIIAPFSWQDLLFGLIRPYLLWLTHLPLNSGDWINFTNVGWTTRLGYAPHTKYGHAFVIVSPNRNELWTDDPAAATELMTKWKVWHKPSRFYSVLEVFGRNVLTMEGQDWARQRRIVNSAFGEARYAKVWAESARQARQMLDSQALGGEGSVDLFGVKRAMDTLTMHVLAAGIFGKELEFESGRRVVERGHKMSFAESQRWILQNLIWVVLLGNARVPRWLVRWLPRIVGEVKENMDEYRAYMGESVEEIRGQKGETTNLLRTIIRENDEAKEEKLVAGGRRMFMTEEELYGNLFILNMAGFETTASSLCFSIPYIAMYPETQQWLYEEAVALSSRDPETLHDDLVNQAPRLTALMHETLRLHGVLQFTFRECQEDQMLQVRDQQAIISSDWLIGVNFASISRHPKCWGSDSDEWRPERWTEHDATAGRDLFKEPPQGAIFVPWMTGPRICPGKKFSQVEFISTMVQILAQRRIELVTEPGESLAEARERVKAVANDIDVKVTPRFNRPHDASVRFVRR